MSAFRTSTRYAKSLLDLSLEMKLVEVVYKDMEMINSTISTYRELGLMLKSPIIKEAQKEIVLTKLFEKRLNSLTMKFIALVAKKSRAALLQNITVQFKVQYMELKGIQEATITTTFPLDEKLRKEFEEVVKDITKKTPSVNEEVSEDIIGGFILDIGDRRIDASVKMNLGKIEYELAH